MKKKLIQFVHLLYIFYFLSHINLNVKKIKSPIDNFVSYTYEYIILLYIEIIGLTINIFLN
jgi:hypothetical protein